MAERLDASGVALPDLAGYKISIPPISANSQLHETCAPQLAFDGDRRIVDVFAISATSSEGYPIQSTLCGYGECGAVAEARLVDDVQQPMLCRTSTEVLFNDRQECCDNFVALVGQVTYPPEVPHSVDQ